jgi:hypothetical protein
MDDIQEENIRRKKNKKISKHFDILINDQTYKIVNFIIKETKNKFRQGKTIKLISKFKITNSDMKDVRIEIKHDDKEYNILADWAGASYRIGENIVKYWIKEENIK